MGNSMSYTRHSFFRFKLLQKLKYVKFLITHVLKYCFKDFGGTILKNSGKPISSILDDVFESVFRIRIASLQYQSVRWK